MKKALLILITLFNAFALHAEDAHRIITFEELPIKAQEFVTTYFSSQTIRFVRMEIEVTKTEYTVESHSECLPSGFLDEMILNFLNKNHPNYCLNEIARDRHKIEVELANGLEIVFNKSGEFLRYDD